MTSKRTENTTDFPSSGTVTNAEPTGGADRPVPDRARLEGWRSTATHHNPLEDAQAIVTGTVLATLGVALLAHLNFLTTGVAGFALIISYAFGFNVGLVFFLINLPFFVLAATRMGRAFTIKTFVAIAVLSVMTGVQPKLFTFGEVDPLAGAVVAGLLIGFAMLALFRHRASLGGVGILAVFLQERFGWRAGLTQLVVDLTILGLSFAVVDRTAVLYSVIGAVVLNVFLAINHRSDRYIAK
ncbi:YitT family protein [Roseibium sp. Sym1]|uniref:YitT family protein n=1 Tax=Roseibium sp. Sym1 TaxID=3016006 RepID=UPI0022B2B868|nr:YitT family protein [Roseibium sp. Sym1]